MIVKDLKSLISIGRAKAQSLPKTDENVYRSHIILGSNIQAAENAKRKFIQNGEDLIIRRKPKQIKRYEKEYQRTTEAMGHVYDPEKSKVYVESNILRWEVSATIVETPDFLANAFHRMKLNNEP